MMSLKVTGRLEELRVDLGCGLGRGDIIARLTPTDFELRAAGSSVNIEQTSLVRQAKAALEEARLQRDRISTFVDRGITAKAELDTAHANLQIADGKYAEALKGPQLPRRCWHSANPSWRSPGNSSRTVLRSPIDGISRQPRRWLASDDRTLTFATSMRKLAAICIERPVERAVNIWIEADRLGRVPVADRRGPDRAAATERRRAGRQRHHRCLGAVAAHDGPLHRSRSVHDLVIATRTASRFGCVTSVAPRMAPRSSARWRG
jgi:hypothetical protein